MLTVPHDSFARGHRVREFVCTYRTLRGIANEATSARLQIPWSLV